MTKKSETQPLIKSAPGATQKRKRVGRGDSSGMGGESGRGHKGAKSRTGYSRRAGFEGGQTPLYRRLPKKRGLGNPTVSEKLIVINLDQLELNFNDGDTVDFAVLIERGLCKKGTGLKVLGNGELNKALKIKAKAVSKSALEKLNSSKSTVELV